MQPLAIMRKSPPNTMAWLVSFSFGATLATLSGFSAAPNFTDEGANARDRQLHRGDDLGTAWRASVIQGGGVATKLARGLSRP